MELLSRTIGFPNSLEETAIEQFHQLVSAAIASNSMVILIDFQAVEFMSSPGLMAMVVALKRSREANKKLLLCSVNEQVKMLLELTGMDQVFEILESPAEADQDVLLSVR
jgi:anti-anti-sigma factor